MSTTADLAVIEASTWIPAVLGGLTIFLCRIADVSIGTMRTIFMLRGRRALACTFAMVEALIYLLAISSVLSGGVVGEPWKVAGYVLGYAGGLWTGMTIEAAIASGWSMIRVIDRSNPDLLAERLRAEGETVTTVVGEGRDGASPILFAVVRRKRAKKVLALVAEVSPTAFVTVDGVDRAMGGSLGASMTGSGPMRRNLPGVLATIGPATAAEARAKRAA